eukprot:m.54329 g.54329  ORF g.54329 m.54329 type:complete len:1839 (-) comp9191_c0_seq1:3357-8873(-)
MRLLLAYIAVGCISLPCGSTFDYGEDDDPAPITRSPTATPTANPTNIPSRSPTAPTAAPTHSPTAAPTAAPIAAPTSAPSMAPTAEPTRLPTTLSPTSPTASPTAMPTYRPTVTPSAEPSVSPSAIPSFAPSAAPTAFPTDPPTATPTGAPTREPTAAPTSIPTAAPTVLPTLVPTAPTATPTAAPSDAPTASPTASPTAPTASPTNVPSAEPTFTPTRRPTRSPTRRPTRRPTRSPTSRPTKGPTARPSTAPTASPTAVPTPAPTAAPSSSPTASPTSPTASPTVPPTATPTTQPSADPTASPTSPPTVAPTAPTASPTADPTNSPTARPSTSPTGAPTDIPTSAPSFSPTATPSSQPTTSPTHFPTLAPTAGPTNVPTAPTASPTTSPTAVPSQSPIAEPTSVPSVQPTSNPTAPTATPTMSPTSEPTAVPTLAPSATPSAGPTSAPTAPTATPTTLPTARPSAAPTVSPSTVPPSTLAPTQDPALSGLCFDFRMQGASGVEVLTFAPITGFPENHVLVQQPVCGYQAAVGELIPPVGKWSTSGDPNVSSTSCEPADSAQLFYAYEYPTHASSNVGFEQANAVLVYFIVDENGIMSLVLTFDVPDDGSGGALEMNINAPSLRGQPVHFAVRDDPHEPVYPDHSQYQWNASGVNENMRWRWGGCCTDGVAFGGLPSDGLNLPFSFSVANGINVFKIATYNRDNSSVSFIDIDRDLVMNAGFTLSTKTCAVYCDSRTNCGECSLDPNCGWCDTTASCHSTNLLDTCPGGLNVGAECCASCTRHTNCSTCADEEGCAWDHFSGECISVSVSESVTTNNTFCSDASIYITHFGTSCSAVCPGSVVSESGNGIDAWCSGNGTCLWQSQTCNCDDGFAGSGCENECPGGASNPCSGHGICTNGECFCDCGWAGTDCSEVGCPCEEETTNVSAVCTFGECTTICGSRLSDQSCTGAGENNTCTCLPGWWGENCTLSCPGIDAETGFGTTCGGSGVCNVSTGHCDCNSCFSANVSSGLCVEDPDIACAHFGAPACIEFPLLSGSYQKGCTCVGQWGGLDCTTCQCPDGVSCNPISGECNFAICTDTQYTEAPGNLTVDTICKNISVCDDNQFETAEPTRTSDRSCQGYSSPCVISRTFESIAPTNTSDRVCTTTTMCSNLDGSFQTVSATATSDAECTMLTNCSEGLEFESARPTVTTDRNCSEITLCDSASYISTVATATSDQICTNVTVHCDLDGLLDLNEVAPPTRTSDRVCQHADDCDSSPCENGGTCIDGVHNYTCDCTFHYPEFLNPNCSVFDACTLEPCQNDGICTTTENGDAVCQCIASTSVETVGACCDGDLSGRPGDVCINTTTAEAQFNDRNNGESKAPAAAFVIIVIALSSLLCCVFLCIAGLLKRKRRRQQQAKDVRCERDAVLKPITIEKQLNPLTGNGFESQSPTTGVLVRGRSLYDCANVRDSGEYTIANEDDDTEYDLGANRRGNEYALGAGRAGGEYDNAQRGGDNSRPEYSEGNNNFEEVYKMATERPEYAIGSSQVAPYEYNEGGPGTYEEAHASIDPDYDGVGEDFTYSNRAALPDSVYGLSAHQQDEVYGIANQKSRYVQQDSVYGLSNKPLSPENAYANRGDRDAENDYGFGMLVRLGTGTTDETYSNRETMFCAPTTGNTASHFDDRQGRHRITKKEQPPQVVLPGYVTEEEDVDQTLVDSGPCFDPEEILLLEEDLIRQAMLSPPPNVLDDDDDDIMSRLCGPGYLSFTPADDSPLKKPVVVERPMLRPRPRPRPSKTRTNFGDENSFNQSPSTNPNPRTSKVVQPVVGLQDSNVRSPNKDDTNRFSLRIRSPETLVDV